MDPDSSLHIRIPLTPGPGAWLLIDAAWPQAAAGVWSDGRWLSFVASEGPAVEALFAIVDRALGEADMKLSGLAGYIFAEGPGSVLGLRTAAMALRAWGSTPGLPAKPILACNSLQLAGALASAEGLGEVTVFAASRRDRWNAWAPGASRWEECDAAALAALPAPHRRLPARDLTPPPVPAEVFDPIAALRRHPEVFQRPGLLFGTEAPDAANIANQYATWAGGRHKG